MGKEIGIIMAAGLGARMYPLTEHTPKPLVRVHGIPMIETVIGGLQSRGISEIHVVVGHLQEQFEYLTEKYRGIGLIRNPEYQSKNNISSLYAAGGILGSADCFICEADLYISDYAIFQGPMERSCYFGKWVDGFSDDWVFEEDQDNRILHIGVGGSDTFNMAGIAYMKAEDARVIADAIRKEYQQPGHESLFWDEVVDRLLGTLSIGIHQVGRSQITEIDTVEELDRINREYGDSQ